MAGVICLGLLVSVQPALADSSDFWRFWKRTGTTLLPLDATWTLGSSATRIAKGWFNEIDITTAVIGGITSGTVIIDVTNTEALLVRKDADAGDIFMVDTNVAGGQTKVSSGTGAAPGLAGISDPNTGLSWDGGDILYFNTGGVNRAYIGSGGTIFYVPFAMAPVGASAGSDSNYFAVNSRTSVGERQMKLYNEGDATTDTYRLKITNNDVATIFTVESNGTVQHQGRAQWKKGADVATANSIQMGYDGNFFALTGAVRVNTIDSTGWQDGSFLVLKVGSAGTVFGHATAGTYAQLKLTGSVNATLNAGNTITFILDGSFWREISRTLTPS